MEKREFSLSDLLALVIKRFSIILIAAILGASAALYYCLFLLAPRYQAVTKYFVDTTGQSILDSTADTSSASVKAQRETVLSRMVVPSYIEILKTHNFAEHIAQKLNQKDSIKHTYTGDELYASIVYSFQEELESYTVTVTTTDPADAFIIARCIEEESEPYLIEKRPGAENTLRIIDNARFPESSISLSTPVCLILGFIVGALLAFCVCLILETTDVHITDEKSLSLLGLTILATIPERTPERSKK